MTKNSMHKVERLASFSSGQIGGNPAGVLIAETLPTPHEMQEIAADIGYSETVFATPDGDHWRTRYFAPEQEIPFCGHATIALGAALAKRHGDGTFKLKLNHSNITVTGSHNNGQMHAMLMSPPTKSHVITNLELAGMLDLFNLNENMLNPRLPPAYIAGGANHFMLALNDHDALSNMAYNLQEGRQFMNSHDLVTIMLVHVKSKQMFDVRNAFASNGIFEDPATGAAAAAFAGYLRDIYWKHQGEIQMNQGNDMKMPSIIHAKITPKIGSAIQVSGNVRHIE